MNRLEGKVALITGGAKGIGEKTAKLFSEHGSTVIVSDFLSKQGNKVVKDIINNGGKAEFFELDASIESQWIELVESIKLKFGNIDILVNNAGIVDPTGLLDTNDTIWNKVMDINAKGVFLGMKHVVPTMAEKQSGSIVNISSMWGIVGAGADLAYQASKGAVRSMSKSAATEYANKGIRVNSVHPGIIATDMVIKDTPMAIRQKIVANTPMGREGKTEEVANLILFLASEDASCITGAEFLVDGGFTAL